MFAHLFYPCATALIVFVSVGIPLSAPLGRLAFSLCIVCSLLLVSVWAIRLRLSPRDFLKGDTILYATIITAVCSFSSVWAITHSVQLIGFASEYGTFASYLILLLACVAGYSARRMHAERFVAWGIVAAGLTASAQFAYAAWFNTVLLIDPSLLGLALLAALSLPLIVLPIVVLFGLVLALSHVPIAGLVGGVLGMMVAYRKTGVERVLLLLVYALISLSCMVSIWYGNPVVVNNTIRPSAPATWYVVARTVVHDPIRILVGEGDGSFERAWNTSRPTAVNYSELWNTDFPLGHSLFSFWLLSAGLVGVVLFLLGIGGVARSSIWLSGTHRRHERDLLPMLSVSLYGVCIAFVYVPPLQVMGIALYALGMCVAYNRPDMKVGQRNGFWFFVLCAVVAVGGIVLLAQRSVAVSMYEEGLIAADKGEYERSALSFEKSYAWSTSAESQLALSRIYTHQLSAYVESQSPPDAITPVYEKAVVASHKALDLKGNNMRYLVEQGTVLYMGVLLGKLDDGTQIARALRAASVQGREHPLPWFLLARISLEARQYDEARSYVARSLELRPQYQEATELLRMIETEERGR